MTIKNMFVDETIFSIGKLVWTVKPEVIESELVEFVQQFNEDYYGKTNEK